ncbi:MULTISPECIES: hypothetical protein [unclassified Novosphingobium]|uniref:hypothetical protein n=1 Tax=unclassified Novosphingobium TaxID=2644732 RepID=UPI00086A85CB|nr:MULTISPECIES: hypothetical protein [unclassified Novosphingobium]MBN9144659.1 hypothetical protein [Novosphingobium sp.]MDR6708297.1 hypothetical protein [Novosphingobium sp. 1748]ODU77857.1 MAG: hypothetical protein ABT10_23880 [Novosphingobium sp. SCN 63-17]OJX92073.1 MAG: hypothetical protein BGP00_07250 [Novosphingobium sp. 63-713]
MTRNGGIPRRVAAITAPGQTNGGQPTKPMFLSATSAAEPAEETAPQECHDVVVKAKAIDQLPGNITQLR